MRRFGAAEFLFDAGDDNADINVLAQDVDDPDELLFRGGAQFADIAQRVVEGAPRIEAKRSAVFGEDSLRNLFGLRAVANDLVAKSLGKLVTDGTQLVVAFPSRPGRTHKEFQTRHSSFARSPFDSSNRRPLFLKLHRRATFRPWIWSALLTFPVTTVAAVPLPIVGRPGKQRAPKAFVYNGDHI